MNAEYQPASGAMKRTCARWLSLFAGNRMSSVCGEQDELVRLHWLATAHGNGGAGDVHPDAGRLLGVVQGETGKLLAAVGVLSMLKGHVRELAVYVGKAILTLAAVLVGVVRVAARARVRAARAVLVQRLAGVVNGVRLRRSRKNGRYQSNKSFLFHEIAPLRMMLFSHIHGFPSI